MMPNLKETKEFLDNKFAGFKPEVAVIVGSGLGGIAGALAKPVTIPYAEIPNFPKSTVAGHAGEMFFGELAGKRVLVLSGRFHLYEGRSLEEVVFPVHVVDALGVKVLLVTNAAGGINPVFNPETGLSTEFAGGPLTAERIAIFRASIPLGRFSTALDVANAVLYLASDEAAFISGVCIEVDGARCV